MSDERETRVLHLKLRSALFDFFLWSLPTEKSAQKIGALADVATLRVEDMLAAYLEGNTTDKATPRGSETPAGDGAGGGT